MTFDDYDPVDKIVLQKCQCHQWSSCRSQEGFVNMGNAASPRIRSRKDPLILVFLVVGVEILDKGRELNLEEKLMDMEMAPDLGMVAMGMEEDLKVGILEVTPYGGEVENMVVEALGLATVVGSLEVVILDFGNYDESNLLTMFNEKWKLWRWQEQGSPILWRKLWPRRQWRTWGLWREKWILSFSVCPGLHCLNSRG